MLWGSATYSIKYTQTICHTDRIFVFRCFYRNIAFIKTIVFCR